MFPRPAFMGPVSIKKYLVKSNKQKIMKQYKLFHFLLLFISIQVQVFRQHIKVKTH